MSDYVISLIKSNYLTDSFWCTSKRRGYSFKQKSYSQWAAEELIRELEANRDTPPLIVVEKFRDKMDNYACMSSKSSYIFSVAYDVAENIIDLLVT